MSLKSEAIVQVDKEDIQELAALAENPIDHWFHKYAGSDVNGIWSFCKKHDIVSEVKIAVNLAEACFQTQAANVHLEVDFDPETQDTKIVINVKLHNRTTQAILAAYDDYVNQSIKSLPRSKSGFIRLSYDVSSSV